MVQKNKPETPFWQPAVEIFAQVTGWIAAPILIALFAGKALDDRYGAKPWIFLSATALAFAVSCYGIVSITVKYTKRIEQELKEKKDKDNTDSSQMNHG